jgi:L-ectoine synthase
VFDIDPGTVYALDQNDRHILKAESTMRMICVFAPALVGPESHDENGSYPRLDPTASAKPVPSSS